MLRALLVSFILATTALPALAAEKRVWRVDSVVATAAGNSIVVEVKGAVQSGGWSRPRLKLFHGDGHTLVIEFLAQPPAANAAVITGLLPMAAKASFRAPNSVATVKAVAEANDVTTQILR